MERHLTEFEIECIAAATHEVNRAYCRMIGDDSQRPWAEASVWQQASARAGVVGVAHDHNTPEQSHAAWSALKVAEGWTLGPVKDEVAKTHPCLVPYDDLPEAQRLKDTFFVTTVEALASAARRHA